MNFGLSDEQEMIAATMRNRKIAPARRHASEMLAPVTDAATRIHVGRGLTGHLPLARGH